MRRASDAEDMARLTLAPAPAPALVATPLVRHAYAFAEHAHRGQRRKDGQLYISHPVRVARILAGLGYGEEVVAAALLHDVVEDTTTDLAELCTRFGPDVCQLVERLTEDEDIRSYRARKAELRHRAVATYGTYAAAVFAADKLASVSTLNADGDVPPAAKLEHYERTLEELELHHPEIPFLAGLTDEVGHMRRRADQSSAGTRERRPAAPADHPPALPSNVPRPIPTVSPSSLLHPQMR